MTRRSSTTEAYALGLAKLESSGLDIDDARQLGIDILEPAETQALHPTFKPVPTLRFNYRDPWNPGRRLQPHPQWPPFYRIRYLKQPTDFTAITNAKPVRYLQEPRSGICAYFPILPDVDWRDILSDANQPLLITEGELKASKATKEGFPTIGLGGVYSWKSTDQGIEFLPELEKINWLKRNVYVIFDSDFRQNPNVIKALNALAEQLYMRGAIPYITPLPDVVEGKDAKTGLDDYLVHCSGNDLGDLIHDRSMLLTLAKPLWLLNDEVIYIHDPGLVVVRETSQKLSPSQFREHAFSTRSFQEQVVNPNGSVSLRPAAASAAWLTWPLRSEAGRLTYRPGKERFVANGTVRGSEYNTWPGWGVEPKKGDVKPFLKLVDHLFSGAEPASKQWFLRWCAYPIQFPGVKMFSSAVIHGVRHGTGKSLIGYTLGRVYGKNFTEIRQADLHGNFNEWAENKQFVLGDDVTGSNKRQDADMLKKLITQQELRLNPKYVPSYVVPDCINYLWTSNQPDAFFLEDTDRRFFIHEVTVEPLSEDFFMDYSLWLDSGGAAALFHHLLHLDLGDFNPAAPALRTKAKERMTEDARSDLGSWVRQLLRSPEALLKVGDAPMPGDLFTNRQLLLLYDPTGHTGTTANGLGRELRRAGIRQVLDGAPVRLPDGNQDRLYAVRNLDRWATAQLSDVQAHLDGVESTKASKTRRKAKY